MEEKEKHSYSLEELDAMDPKMAMELAAEDMNPLALKIASLRMAGFTPETIAKRVDRSTETIHRILQNQNDRPILTRQVRTIIGMFNSSIIGTITSEIDHVCNHLRKGLQNPDPDKAYKWVKLAMDYMAKMDRNAQDSVPQTKVSNTFKAVFNLKNQK